MVDAHTSPAAFEFRPRAGGKTLDPSFRSVLDALDTPLAILDASGTVVAVNGAWRTTPETCDPPMSCLEGENYLDWCATLSDEIASETLSRGAKRVLAGVLSVYVQTVRASPAGEGREVAIRLRRLTPNAKRLCLVSHEPKTTGEEIEDRLLSAQLEERERLAADLHDSVGQNLVCLGLGLTRLRRLSMMSAELEAVVADMDEALEHAHGEIRTLSFLLRPPWLDEAGAFVKAARDLVAGFARRSGLQATMEVVGAPRGLCRARELTLFRVLQEALVNIHRHAHADSVEVALTHKGRNVTLRVSDDGQGMAAPEGMAPVLGVGLLSMRARLRKFGGDLRIVTGADGTTLTAILPV